MLPTQTTIIQPEIPDLPKALRALLRQIPKGQVTTYGDLAAALGSGRAARWVGEYLADHDHKARCHCHRVIRATGEPGLYVTGNGSEKIHKLTAERCRSSPERSLWPNADSPDSNPVRVGPVAGEQTGKAAYPGDRQNVGNVMSHSQLSLFSCESSRSWML